MWEHWSIVISAFKAMGQDVLIAYRVLVSLLILKQYQDYKPFYKTFKMKRLWNNELHTAQKFELGIYIEDICKIMHYNWHSMKIHESYW